MGWRLLVVVVGQMQSIAVAGTGIDAGAAIREICTVGTARRADLIKFLWHGVARGILSCKHNNTKQNVSLGFYPVVKHFSIITCMYVLFLFGRFQ